MDEPKVMVIEKCSWSEKYWVTYNCSTVRVTPEHSMEFKQLFQITPDEYLILKQGRIVQRDYSLDLDAHLKALVA